MKSHNERLERVCSSNLFYDRGLLKAFWGVSERERWESRDSESKGAGG